MRTACQRISCTLFSEVVSLNNPQKPIKVYVPVEVAFDENGHMYPRLIHWEDGKTYESTAFWTCVRLRRRAQVGRATGTPSG